MSNKIFIKVSLPIKLLDNLIFRVLLTENIKTEDHVMSHMTRINTNMSLHSYEKFNILCDSHYKKTTE